MPRLLLAFILMLGLSTCAANEFRATPISLADQVGVGDAYAGIRLLGALRLANTQINGLRLCGLSGLAWDEDEGLLYAISDYGQPLSSATGIRCPGLFDRNPASGRLPIA